MLSMRPWLVCWLVLFVTPGTAQPPVEGESLKPVLPSVFYAVVGVEMSVYFDNVVLTKTPEAYQFEVTCELGESQRRRWTITPVAAEVGDHRLTIRVRDMAGNSLGHAATTLRVIAADAGAQRPLGLLIVGDSLTHGTLYPNELAKLLSTPGNPKWRMLGTHQPPQAAKGVAHEGYGGWTWQRFVTKYEPNPDGTHRKRSSPFVYLSAAGKPTLDVARYLREQQDLPDMVIFMLGINDCFSAPPHDNGAIDARIDKMFESADVLLDAFRAAAPSAELAICLTTPPNSRDAAFESNYQGAYHRWGWKRIQHRLVQRQMERFDHPKSQVLVLPTQLNLDPTDGYPIGNGVHPNAQGYRQIAASIYACIKSRLRDSRQE